MKIRQLTFLIIYLLSIMQLSSQTFEGTVLNKQINKPVSNANIVVKNSPIGTVSNKEGYFSLQIRDKRNIILQISHLGYDTKEIEIDASTNTDKLQIQLEPISVQLNKSIVVTASKKEVLSFQTPDAVSV